MIELKVEEYCHDCPEFEADCCKVYANGHIERTMVKCANAAKCSRIRRYLSDSYNEPEPEPTTPDIKLKGVFKLCKKCADTNRELLDSLSKGTEEEVVTPGPIKSYELCRSCIFAVERPHCSKRRGYYNCGGCTNHIGGNYNCACVTIEMGKPCPFYKEVKNEK